MLYKLFVYLNLGLFYDYYTSIELFYIIKRIKLFEV